MLNKFSNKQKVGRYVSKMLALLLSFVLVFGTFSPLTVAAEEAAIEVNPLRLQLDAQAESGELELTPEGRAVFEEIQAQNAVAGLVGFEGNYALPQDGSPVNVIVIFDVGPAGIQQLEAAVERVNLSRIQAEASVEEAHSSFRAAMAGLFNVAPFSARSASEFNIYAEFRLGINGVGLTVPADMLDAVVELPMVRAIVPDALVEAPEEPTPLEDVMDALEALWPYRDPIGNRAGRHRMNANWMHEQGYTGEGILIAVLDTGIDWMHPAFRETFPTVAQMRARGAMHITNANAINIGTAANPDYRFVGWDMIRYWPDNPHFGNPHPNDPMEAAPFNLADVPNPPAGWTSHGTHVAGSIVGRDVAGHFTDHPELFQNANIVFNPQGGTVVPTEGNYPVAPVEPDGGGNVLDFSILGVSPDALAVHYRVLWGSTPTTVIGLGIEQAVIDGADVVNMSLGGGTGNAIDLQAIMINNIMLQNPEIVFVISAGNSGPGFTTIGNPGSSTLALTISALVEPRATSVAISAPTLGVIDAQALMTFSLLTLFTDTDTIPGRVIFNHPAGTRNDANGNFTVFAMPDASGTGWGGTGDDAVAPEVGAGTLADFEALYELHGSAIVGNWVLVRRGFTFVDIAEVAYEMGLGGVIQINTVHQLLPTTATFDIPFLAIVNDAGRAMSTALTAGNGVGTFYIPDFYGAYTDLHVIPFSSRGPILNSFEVSPDFGANGVDVLSAIPRWSAGLPWDNDHMDDESFRMAYGLNSGTSMSAPHVAGGVALLIQYMRANNIPVNNQDIKTRLSNTAIPVTYTAPGEHGGYGVFDGGRQVDLRAAIQATTRVSGLTLAPTEAGWPFISQPQIFARTGSVSFGAVAANSQIVREMVINTSVGGTFNVTGQFIDTGRYSVMGGSLQFSSNGTTWVNALNVNATSGSESRFYVRLTTTGAGEGQYEGYITVTSGGNQIARLPFGGISFTPAPMPVDDIRFYRPIVSTGENIANVRSSQLAIYYVPNAGFSFDMFMFRVEGNDLIPAGTPSGFVGTRWFGIHGAPDFIGSPLGALYRSNILDVAQFELPEGEYRLRLDMSYANWVGLTFMGSTPSESVYLPFWVDNTPPEITNLGITGLDLQGNDLNNFNGEILMLSSFNPAAIVTLTGNVRDVFTAENQGNHNISFDIWTSPQTLNVADHVVLFASINNAPAVQVPLEPNGDFTLNHPTAGTMFMDIQLWALDAWSAMPVFEAFIPTAFAGNAPANTPGAHMFSFSPNFNGSHMEIMNNAILAMIPFSDRVWSGGVAVGPGLSLAASGLLEWFAFTGVNVATFETLIAPLGMFIDDINFHLPTPPTTPEDAEEPEEEELEEPGDEDEPENGGEPGDEDEPEETDHPSPPEDPEEEELEEPEDEDEPENGGESEDDDEPEETDPPSPPEDPATEESNLTLISRVANTEFSGTNVPVGNYVATINENGLYTATIGVQQRFGNNLPSATRPGFIFAGWNTQPDGRGANFTADTVVTGDMTVYAIWQSPPPPPLLPPGPAQPEDDFLDGPVIPITPWVPRPTTQVAADPADPDEADEPVLPGFVNPDGTVDLTFTMTVAEAYELVLFLPGVDDGVYELEIEGLPAGARIDQTAALPDWAFDVALERFLEMQEDEEEAAEGVATLFRRLAPQFLSLNLVNIASLAQTEGLSPETIAGVEAILEEMLFKEITDQILSLELLDVTDDMVGTHVLNLSLLDQNSDEVINLPNLVLVIEPTAVEEPPVVEQPPQQLVTAPQPVETRFIVGSPSFTVNGVPRTDAEGLAPFIDPEYDRTMMPLRLIAEIFGAEVSWNEETRTAIIISGGITLQIPLDTPLPDGLGMPSIVNDRAFVPLRYIAENLGVQVEWDGVNQAIYIRQ